MTLVVHSMVPHYHGSTAKNRYIPTTKVDLNRSRHFKVDPISPFNFLSIGCGLIHWDSIVLKLLLYHVLEGSRLGALYENETKRNERTKRSIARVALAA